METTKDTTDMITLAADAIRAGELVAFPTDTVYGIGCDPFNEDAVANLRAAKRRPDEKNIPVLVDSFETAHALGEIPDFCSDLIEKHWPGALTIVVASKAPFPSILTNDNTIALRMPNHNDLLELLTACGGALAATSANISGKPPITNYDETYALFADVAAFVLPGAVTTGVSSTVIDCTGTHPKVLREGAVATSDL